MWREPHSITSSKQTSCEDQKEMSMHKRVTRRQQLKKLSALCAADPLQAMLRTGGHNQSRQWSLECYARPIYQCCVYRDAREALTKNSMYMRWAHHLKTCSAMFIVIGMRDWFALANYNYCQINGASRGKGFWLSSSVQKVDDSN